MPFDRHLLIPGLEHVRAEPDCVRLVDALMRRPVPERVPPMELMIDDPVTAAILGRPVTGVADAIELYTRLGYDAVPLRVSPPLKRARQFAPDTAPTSQAERGWAQAGAGLIKSWADYEAYPWPTVDDAVPALLERAGAGLLAGMGLFLRSSGVFENVMWLMGYEAVSEALCEDPALFEVMANRVGNLLVETFQQGIDFEKVAGVFFGEDMGFKTSTMISPDHLRTYILPWHKRIASLCHERDKILILHSCGHIDPIMTDLIEDVGIDAKHSFEDAIEPVVSFKRRYGDRIGVVGGIDMDALAQGTPDTVAAYTRRVLEQCAPGGGYALGSGNSIANYIPVENYFAMLREGFHFRVTP